MYERLDIERLVAMGDVKTFRCSDEFLRAERQALAKDIDALFEIANRYPSITAYIRMSDGVRSIARLLWIYIARSDLYNIGLMPTDKRTLLRLHEQAYLRIREELSRLLANEAAQPSSLYTAELEAVKDILVARIERMDWFPDPEVVVSVKSILDININLKL